MRSANGTYTEERTFSDGGAFNGYLRIFSDGASEVSIDNVSLKEVTGQEVVPNSGCGSWLFEPQSTNLVTYSEDISNSYWRKLGSSTTSGFTSPSGVGNAYKLVEDTSNGLHWMYSGGITVTNATTYNVSVFAKKGERNSIRIAEKSGISVIVNLESKDFDTISAGVIDSNITELVDDWIKIDYSFQTTSTSEEVYIYAADNGNINYQGNGSSGIYVWGVQLEQLSYTTSYIPTNGAASTRLQDIANNSGNSDLFNSTEGVLYAEIAALTDLGSYRLISLNSDNSSSNRITIAYDVVNNQIYGQCVAGGVSQALFTTQPTSISDFNKIALKYKANDLAFWVNGFEVGTNTSASIPTNLNRLSFDRADAAAFFYGKNKALAVWKEALTDTELELLTAPAPEFPTFSLDFDTIAEQFTFTRGSEATFVNEQGLIQSTNELGAELVNSWTNQDFSSFASNGSNITQMVSSGSGNNCYSPTTITSGKTYKMEFTCSQNITAQIRISNNNNLTSAQVALSNPISGLNSIIFTANANYTYVGFYAASVFSDTQISGFTLKEHITATNTPRIDYSTGVEAFLLEPQSTNLYPYSQTITSGGLTFFTGGSATATLTNNYSISPDGTQNALRFQATVLNDIASRAVVRSLLSTSAVMSTVSVYAKSNTNENYTMIFHYKGGVRDTFVVTPEWQRFSFSEVSDATNNVGIELRGTYTSLEADVSLWGFQFENQSYATSVIPTDGASATRNAETCVDATPTINSEEGVLYAEISALADDGTNRYITLSDGTADNSVRIYLNSNGTQLSGQLRSVGGLQCLFNHTVSDLLEFNKIAFSYKQNDFSFWINGIEVDTDTNGNTPIGLSKLSFDRGDGTQSFFGNTKGLQVFDKALSDYQLKQLTTI